MRVIFNAYRLSEDMEEPGKGQVDGLRPPDVVDFSENNFGNINLTIVRINVIFYRQTNE